MNREIALNQLKKLKKYGKPMRLAAEKWQAPWQCLISTALSARTKDETTIKAANNLFRKYRELDDLAKADINKVKELIRSVNYYKTKSKHIIAAAEMIKTKFKGKVPLEINKLLKIPGVGRKTANVFLSEMGKPAIGVDTHVAKISYRLKWTKHKKPDRIEEDLKKLFPKYKWREVNSTLVRFGRTYSGKKREEILNEIEEHTL